MKKYIYSLFLVCLAPQVGFCADGAPATEQGQMAALDKQIKEFKDARDVAKMRAYEAGSQADQFLGQSWTDYQRAIRKQEFYQNQVKELDAKIKELEAQKAALR